MRFTSWLWDQIEFEGTNYRIAKLCWDDVNNGCANTIFSIQDWIKHFEAKHPDKKDTLIGLTFTAYLEFLKEVQI